MRRRILLAAMALLLAAAPGSLRAALIVNGPQQITRQVTVQLIQTALDNGSSPATVFGSASQRADIEAGLDTIWAQAGIDIKVLPTITQYNNTFAYQGSPTDEPPRSTGDFETVFDNAASAGKLNSDLLTLNLIMVKVLPGFDPLAANVAAGYAWIGANGMMGYVGSSLLGSEDGRDVIASVFGHEIGHNLGLSHTANGLANLMSPQGTSQQLTSGQIITARSSNFARLYTPPATATGDYNKNGVVDAADYIVWRNTLNQSGGGLPADGDGSGTIGFGDYTVWRNHFGSTPSAGSTLEGDGAVPEPGSIVCLIMTLQFLVRGRRRIETDKPFVSYRLAWTFAAQS
jgi:hypothetical protein